MKKSTGIILSIAVIAALGFAAWKFYSPSMQSVYVDSYKVPCTYSGCENSVSCPPGYARQGCSVGPTGSCDCIKAIPCNLPSDCEQYSRYPYVAGECGARSVSWTCEPGYGLEHACAFHCIDQTTTTIAGSGAVARNHPFHPFSDGMMIAVAGGFFAFLVVLVFIFRRK